ncbi:3681_t:CDS:1 [Funneliformis caledonium]|uniref:3681_t:CDS:1 n=1 Tax=Funneliformis caledonium TaxID=1117310 RepID=A0A9N9HVG7_9GLOM|nr:3681_t:CDS:1 [Funneliformis caledonium]
MYKQSALENDGVELNFMNDENKYSPRNDQELCEFLCRFVSKGIFRFTVFIETLSKPFNSWTFLKVCELYELSDNPNSDIDVYHRFHCGSADLDNEKSKAVLKHLMAELDLRKKTTH